MNTDTSSLPLAGQVALVTGANTGIGRVMARELARQGARVFLACRSAERTAEVLAEIDALPGARSATWLPLELGDFASVGDCAQRFLDLGLPLHLLVNNAGLAGARGLTRSGFEMAFGVNHMGHFLLTQRLLPALRASGAARIVTLASRAHRRVNGIPFEQLRQPTRTATGVAEYSVSKLANLLFSAELGRRLTGTGISTYAVHPGVVASDIWRTLPAPLRPLFHWLRRMITVEEGARTPLLCASAPALAGQSGLYWSDGAPAQPSPAGRDAELARALWQHSEDWTR
ncbi:SDR family NAD(P)-dependent oxidoreductase [Ideonella dechloratans]|uniref:SDR family NAD(P)-dependent oxidoreductase n=1 Tax=Ideonella dechloratans TaxID=36863 RepID=A0A643F9M6_IDEDE|nr:SDR family NAD(P)-dependent oxidoreductase [Ideonella dechloratans]KAB0579338.1 SDR family NAD(P)-dependent oxidoreductase [Ideonella dechloratans]UFU09748.1 SDR family NAD(P)-dependent oxidoreductase [Ideonella dechloratans]